MEQKNLIIVDKAMLRRDAAGNLVLPENAEFEMTPEMYMQAYALCPLDGRYQQIQHVLAPYFSDFALTWYRVIVEVRWLVTLIRNLDESATLKAFDFSEICDSILDIAGKFDERDYFRTKEIEKVTHHDVKAVEIFVTEELTKLGFEQLVSFTHFGCTSEDITNLAYGMMIADALYSEWIPKAEKLVAKLHLMAEEYAETAMPAHTHGQKATPTTFGKEIAVFSYRLNQALERIKRNDNITAKLNGATGNYAAAMIAFPTVDWEKMSKSLIIDELDLDFKPITTQIEGHDYVCHILDDIRHFNNVLLDFDWDMWSYISRDYLKLLVIKSEVGSSTMPQKVNPIHFENSASNIDTSNALAMGLSNKLPVSHMQRDLSDSSSKRNLGMVFGYSLLAIESATSGLERSTVNEEKMAEELDSEWNVLGEAVQTMLRKYGVTDAYEQLKRFTRGKHITKEVLHDFINSFDMLSDEDRTRLLELTPATYTGLASQIAKTYSYN